MASEPPSSFSPLAIQSQQLSPEQQATRKPIRPSLTTPFTLRTQEPSRSSLHASAALPPLTTPATLRHATSAPEAYSRDRLSLSPRAERLPSFRQLSKIAAAGEDDTRVAPTYPAAPPPLPPPQSYAVSMPSHSPVARHQPFPQHVTQASPAPSAYPSYYQQASPTTQSDPYYNAHSPPSTTYPAPSHYYSPTTSSAPHRPGPYPVPPASLTSNNSSMESGRSQQSSGLEAYSTAHTTPIDPAVSHDPMMNATPTGPPSMPLPAPSLLHGNFTCGFPDCTALPFQTQYLLK